MPEWTLSPGQRIKRTTLHRQFGGQRQSGISPSRTTPNVFVFSDPSSGEKHGYRDGWRRDGYFHYTGEGQRGDQQMVRGNRAILDAARDRRVLRVFDGVGGALEYQGRFALAERGPWYRARAHSTGKGRKRSVIVFRLRPIGSRVTTYIGKLAVKTETRVKNVPIESRYAEEMVVSQRELYRAKRRESALVQEFSSWMERKGHTVRRQMITPANEPKALFTDIFVEDLNILVEAKGSTDRGSIRMAIGQLLDYRRFSKTRPPKCAVLLPALPGKDLLELLAYAGVSVLHRLKGSFAWRNAKGTRLRFPGAR